MKCKRHRFPSDVYRHLKAYRPDNWHAAAAICEDYAVIALGVAAPYLLTPFVPWWISYIFVSLPLIGCRQRALATLLHESAHRTLARHATWNYLAGSFFSGYLVFQSWYAYYQSHVVDHHAGFNDPERDPDLKYLMAQGVYSTQTRLTFVLRYLVGPLFLLKTPGKLIDLIRYRFVSRQEPMWERVAKLLYITSLAGALVVSGLGSALVCFWLVPYLTVFPIVNWYIELSEHYPLMGNATSDLYMSRNRWTGRLSKFFLGIHNENYHLIHHLAPSVPFWRMPDAHRVMLADGEYRSVQTRELGLILPLLPGIPSLVCALSRGLGHAVEASVAQGGRQ